jgi:hypothetical protein
MCDLNGCVLMILIWIAYLTLGINVIGCLWMALYLLYS